MPEYLATLIAALIGAIIGSVVPGILAHFLTIRREESLKRELLVQRYLYQLQDAAESLRYRITNLEDRKLLYAQQIGLGNYYRDYLETTILYALGRVLAVEHIFALEAVYPQLDNAYPKLGEQLRGLRLDNIGVWENLGFYKYDRVSLAEAVIEREGDRFRPSTYLEFRRKIEAEQIEAEKIKAEKIKAEDEVSAEIEWLTPTWLTPARHVASKIRAERSEGEIQQIHELLGKIVHLVVPKTGIDTLSDGTT